MVQRLISPLQASNPAGHIAYLVRRGSWYRLVVLAEVAVLLVFTVALTIAPQVTLTAIAALLADARDASLANRPLVALLGLVGFCLTAIVLRALLLPRVSSAARPTRASGGPSDGF